MSFAVLITLLYFIYVKWENGTKSILLQIQLQRKNAFGEHSWNFNNVDLTHTKVTIALSLLLKIH